jgi:hypothetical protein
VQNKTLCMNHPCAICSTHGNYTHHYLDLGQLWAMLVIVCQTTLPTSSNLPLQLVSQLPLVSEPRSSTIHYMSTSMASRNSNPCYLCGKFDHITHLCPIIIEYWICCMVELRWIHESLPQMGAPTLKLPL